MSGLPEGLEFFFRGPDGFFGRHTHAIGHQLVACRETAVRVLRVDEGGDQIDHGSQDIALVRERVLQAASLATDVRAFTVGDGFVRYFGQAAHPLRNGEKP